MHALIYSILGLILLVASISDIHYQKIPNALTIPGVIAGIIIYAVSKGGWQYRLTGLEGFAVGILPMLLPFLMGLMGAGDVKLMGAVGSFLGPKGAFAAFLLTTVIGGVYSAVLFMLQWRRDAFRQLAISLGVFFRTGKSASMQNASLMGSEAGKGPRLYYGVAIALGTGLSVLLSMRGAF